MVELPDWSESFPKHPPVPLGNLFTKVDAEGLELMARMLEHNPETRISAQASLSSPYFPSTSVPAAAI